MAGEIAPTLKISIRNIGPTANAAGEDVTISIMESVVSVNILPYFWSTSEIRAVVLLVSDCILHLAIPGCFNIANILNCDLEFLFYHSKSIVKTNTGYIYWILKSSLFSIGGLVSVSWYWKYKETTCSSCKFLLMLN